MPFRSLLLPGTYFANAGVTALRGGEEQYVHRVVDAMMFRVLEDRKSTIVGLVDLTLGQTCRLTQSDPQ